MSKKALITEIRNLLPKEYKLKEPVIIDTGVKNNKFHIVVEITNGDGTIIENLPNPDWENIVLR